MKLTPQRLLTQISMRDVLPRLGQQRAPVFLWRGLLSECGVTLIEAFDVVTSQIAEKSKKYPRFSPQKAKNDAIGAIGARALLRLDAWLNRNVSTGRLP